MEVPMLRLALATLVLAHGVGHILFLGPALRLVDWAGQTSHSWLLSAPLGDVPSRAVAGVVWSVSIVLFVGGVAGYVTDAPWWRGAAVAASLVSLAGVVLFWDGLAMASAAMALTVDVVILVALLLAHWPAATEVGA
jgi:hypothetical protein